MNSAERAVLAAYKYDPDLVNDDKKLIPYLWREEGWDDNKTLEQNFAIMPNSESITRARRKLHELGYIKYSKEAHQKRMTEFKDKSEYYGTPKVVFDKETNTAKFV